MTKSKRHRASASNRNAALRIQIIHSLYNSANPDEGFLETLQFRDSLGGPARHFRGARANQTVTWWTDRPSLPFIFFPENAANWDLVDANTPLLFDHTGRPAAFGSSPDAQTPGTLSVKLRPKGILGTELHYTVQVGKKLSISKGPFEGRPEWDNLGETPSIVRATIILQG